MIVSDRACKDVTTADGMPMGEKTKKKKCKKTLGFSGGAVLVVLV